MTRRCEPATLNFGILPVAIATSEREFYAIFAEFL